MSWLKEHIGQFIIGLVLLVAGFFSNVFYSDYKNKTQYLDYIIDDYESILKGAKEIADTTLIISAKGKRLENITELDIQILNLSNADFENVPLYIDLYPDEGATMNLISVYYFDQNKTKEQVEILPVDKSLFKNGKRFGFNVKVMNRSEHDIVFLIKFLFEGESAPNAKIQISKAGLEVRQYAKANYELFSNSKNVSEILLFILSLTVFSLFGNLLLKNSENKTLGKLIKNLTEKNTGMNKDAIETNEQLVKINKDLDKLAERLKQKEKDLPKSN